MPAELVHVPPGKKTKGRHQCYFLSFHHSESPAYSGGVGVGQIEAGRKIMRRNPFIIKLQSHMFTLWRR